MGFVLNLAGAAAVVWLVCTIAKQPPAAAPHCSDRGFAALESEVSLPGFREIGTPVSEVWARSACGLAAPPPDCRLPVAVYRCTLVRAAIAAAAEGAAVCDKINAIRRGRPWPPGPGGSGAWRAVADAVCDAPDMGRVKLTCSGDPYFDTRTCAIQDYLPPAVAYEWPTAELGAEPVLLAAVSCPEYTCVPVANQTVYETEPMYRPLLDCCA